MSLLKKIFGKNSEPERSQRPRPPRIRVSELHRVEFHAADGQGYKVGNVSVRGVGFLRSEDVNMKVNDVVKGTISIDSKTFDVEAIVRHTGAQLVGCEITKADPKFSQAVESYFKVELLGVRLRKVDESVLKPDPRGKVAWFTDGKHNEIYCLSDAQGLLSAHATFFGTYVEGGRNEPLRSGHLQEDSSEASFGIKGSQMLDLGPASPEMLAVARLLVTHVESMPDDLKEQLLRLFQS